VSRTCRQTKPAAFFIAASFSSTIGILESLVKRSKDAGYNSVFVADELEKILALSRYDGGYSEREPRRGAVWGLDVTGMGKGAIMPVESIAVDISSSPVRLAKCVLDSHIPTYYPLLELRFFSL
jgi:hypothetical protein